MTISKIVAQEIVEEIETEIHEHINIMDADGRIIASTDPQRIGTLHEGARRIVSEHLPALYITPEMETETTRAGVNLPIIVRDEIVGVVGITGRKERVAGYGNIVRRMTEIMLKDSIKKDVKRYDRRVRYRFLDEWLQHPAAIHEAAFVHRGQHLGIDVTRPYRIMILYFQDFQNMSATWEGQKKLDEMETALRHVVEQEKDMLYLREPPRQVILLPNCSDEAARRQAAHWIELIDRRYHKQMIAGIDSHHGNKQMVSHSYKQAERALNSAALMKKAIVTYDEMSVESFLNEISETTMAEYTQKLFYDINEALLESYMNLISAYFIYDGSIQQMADALYMHKNTLQYKLKKMRALTGIDIRRPSETASFYMALLFYRRLHPA